MRRVSDNGIQDLSGTLRGVVTRLSPYMNRHHRTPLNMYRPAIWLTMGLLSASALAAPSFVYETDKEFYGSGDFNGDGRTDVIVINRFLSKYELMSRYRVGYQDASGGFTWGRVQLAEIPKVNGVAIGQLLEEGKDALAVTAAEASLINIFDIGDPDAEPSANMYMGSTLGPNALVALDIGGDGNNGLDDLVTSTVYNAPVEHHLETLRNEGGAGMPLEDLELDGEVVRANPVVLKQGGKVLAAALVRTESVDNLRVADFSSGLAEEALRIDDLPKGSDYVVGRFGKSQTASVIVYTSGGSDLAVYQLSESGGRYRVAGKKEYSLGDSVRFLAVSGEGESAGLVATFGNGSRAALYAFDGVSEPKAVQQVEMGEDEVVSGLVPVGGQIAVFVRRPTSWYTTHFQSWKPQGGKLVASSTVELPTTDESVHYIAPLLEANNDVRSAADMKAYTATIPGTKVTYSMAPIPAGEFVMGTPEGEDGREDSEGPQVKVQVDPFWMMTTEVTWDMYTLFMYSDEERKYKDSLPTEAEYDTASDAVARPSKPYTEMSFGMGKDGFPAIAMTHYAASKFCQWLSAKTGHYYRLPTEAEWEYACRAGTTTAYNFGDSPDDLEDRAWYEMNSDFVYQKVGKKEPNGWGLYDMHGNVMEWCADAYAEDYSWMKAGVKNPWNRPAKPYPHVARGGSYDDMAESLRSGARRASDPSWKMTDPQLPKSIWWLSDNKMIGFRVVRPLVVPDAETLSKRWNTQTERQ